MTQIPDRGPDSASVPSRPAVPPGLDRAAAWSWRIVVVAVVIAGAMWLVTRLWLVLVPIVVAVVIARILIGPVDALHGRGVRRGLAAALALAGFLIAIAGATTLVGLAVADEFDSLGPTLDEAMNDIERWLVEDSPFDLDRSTVQEVRDDLGSVLERALRGSGEDVVGSAILAAEVVVGLFVGIVLGFFALKDGGRFLAWVRRRIARGRREDASRAGRRAWATLGGFLRGAALLGLIEAVVIGLTVLATGGSLVVPIAVFTFLAAFVPFVGAIAAGVMAVLVTLTTAGPAAAAVVAIVVIVLQQFDNEVFAPLVYGHSLHLHPVVVLLSVVLGGAAFGVAGSVFAVPVAAILINVFDELYPAAELTTGSDE